MPGGSYLAFSLKNVIANPSESSLGSAQLIFLRISGDIFENLALEADSLCSEEFDKQCLRILPWKPLVDILKNLI